MAQDDITGKMEKLNALAKEVLPTNKHVCDPIKCKIYHDAIKKVIEFVWDGKLISEARQLARIKRSTFYDHLTPELSESLKHAKINGPCEVAEDELYNRGVNGWEEPVFYKGYEVSRIVKKSDTALICYLNANNPRYRQSNQVTVNNSNTTVNVTAEVKQLILSESETEKALLESLGWKRDNNSLSGKVDTGANGGNGNGHTVPAILLNEPM